MIKNLNCEGFQGATTGEWNRVGPNETSSRVIKKNASSDSKNRQYRFQF